MYISFQKFLRVPLGNVFVIVPMPELGGKYSFVYVFLVVLLAPCGAGSIHAVYASCLLFIWSNPEASTLAGGRIQQRASHSGGVTP